MTVRSRFVTLACMLVGAFAVSAAPAWAQVYRCQSPNGVPVYQGTPDGTNCEPVELQPLTTILAPKLPAAKPAPAARPAPDGFPKVDAAQQRARDGDRRRILEDELSKEQARLAELKSEYKDGEPDRLGSERNYQKYLDRVARLEEDIGRTEGNIVSLRRELGMDR